MTRRARLERIPLESPEPLRSFAAVRVGLAACALLAALVFGVPHSGRLALVIGALAVPWSVALAVVASRRPHATLSAAVPLVDVALLALAELAAPDSYAAVRLIAVVLVAAHAAVLGDQRGGAVALVAVAVLVPIAGADSAPVSDGLLAFYEVMFAASAIAVALFVGHMRTAESTGRLRARELSRRAIEAENEVRRRVAESIHDGPVQELVSLDMMLESARRSLARGDSARAQQTLEEARRLTERNVDALREEIIGLGPYAFDELSLDAALEQCIPIWSRRYDFTVEVSIERLNLSSELSGALFGIAQEAIANAGRHAGASAVTLSLAAADGAVAMRIVDDGHGFQGPAPLAARAPGHIGLASMRERAESQGGTLTIESSERGTAVAVEIPVRASTDVRAPAPVA